MEFKKNNSNKRNFFKKYDFVEIKKLKNINKYKMIFSEIKYKIQALIILNKIQKKLKTLEKYKKLILEIKFILNNIIVINKKLHNKIYIIEQNYFLKKEVNNYYNLLLNNI